MGCYLPSKYIICLGDHVWIHSVLEEHWEISGDSEEVDRLLPGAGHWEHVTPLHWLMLCFWAQFQVLVMTFEAFCALGPPPT